MSRHAEITRLLGAEERRFRLGLGQLRALQEKCDAGPGEIAARLFPAAQVLSGDPAALLSAFGTGSFGRWRIDDVRETIYQGLIGGGETPTMAGALVAAIVDEAPVLTHVLLALEILLAAVMGVPDEPAPGNADAEAGADAQAGETQPAPETVNPDADDGDLPDITVPAL